MILTAGSNFDQSHRIPHSDILSTILSNTQPPHWMFPVAVHPSLPLRRHPQPHWTYQVPTPKSSAMIPSPAATTIDVPSPDTSSFRPFLPPKPSPKDYPVTGSTAIRHFTNFDVHRYIGCRHLRDYIAIHKYGTDIRVVSQGETPLSP
jgi:hypothetical protein